MKLWKLKKSTYGLDNRFDRARKKIRKVKVGWKKYPE